MFAIITITVIVVVVVVVIIIVVVVIIIIIIVTFGRTFPLQRKLAEHDIRDRVLGEEFVKPELPDTPRTSPPQKMPSEKVSIS